MDRIRIGLVGYKFMGKAHSDALTRIPAFFDPPYAVEKTALCGRDRDWAADAARRYGWRSVETDYRSLVERPDIDAVDITAPSNMHREIAVAAARAGKHVFCEKPLALNLADAREMLAEAQKAGVKHQIGFNYRRTPALMLARKLIDEGRLGKIFHFRGCFLQEWLIDPEFPRVWRLDKKVCGSGSLGDLGAHVIDAARYLMGDIRTVAGMSKTFIAERPACARMEGLTASASTERETVDVDDATQFLCEFENGALGLFEATRFAQGHSNDMRLEINGEKGSIRFAFERMNELEFFDATDRGDVRGFRTIQATGGPHPYGSIWWPAGHVIGYAETFCNQLYEFCQSVHEDRPCTPDFGDGVKCAQIMEAVELSIERKGWVEVGTL